MSAQVANSAGASRGTNGLVSEISFGDRYVFLPVICVYAFLVQFGSLTRFSEDETSRGLTTLIVFLLLIVGAMKLTNSVLQEPTFWWLLPLVLYLFIPSVFSNAPLPSAFKTAQLLAYVLLAAVVARTRFDESGLSKIWLCIAAGLAMSGGLTVIDFVGIVDVPRNNEAVLATHLGDEAVMQASGFFFRRSGMAAIFCMGISGSLALALCPIALWRRLFFAGAALSGVVSLFLTHNRSGILGSIAAVSLLILFSSRFSGVKKVGSFAAAAVLGVSFLGILATYFPDILAVYAAQLGFLGLSKTSASASDIARVDMFIFTVRSVGYDPLGHGWTLIPWRWKMLDAHNMVATLIWGAGIVGLVWLPAFAVFMTARLRTLGRTGSPYHTAVGCALVAWLFNGLVHNILFASLAWMFLGVLLSRLYFDRGQPVPGENSSTTAQEPLQTPWVPRRERA